MRDNGSKVDPSLQAWCPKDGEVLLERVDTSTARCRDCRSTFVHLQCTGPGRHLFWHPIDPSRDIQRGLCPTCSADGYHERFNDAAVAKLQRDEQNRRTPARELLRGLVTMPRGATAQVPPTLGGR